MIYKTFKSTELVTRCSVNNLHKLEISVNPKRVCKGKKAQLFYRDNVNVSMSGTSVDRALELGTKYFKVQDYRNAKEVFIKAIKLVQLSRDDEIIKLRESLNLTSHTYTMIDDKVHKIVVHPRHIKLLDNLSASWEKLGELEKALRITDKMIQKEPYNLRSYIRRGSLLQRLKRYKDALLVYTKALRMAKYGHETLKIEYSQKFIDFIQNQKRHMKDILQENRSDSKEKKSSKRVFIDPVIEHANQDKRLKMTLTDPVNEPAKVDFIKQLPLELLPIVLHNFKSSDLLKISMVSKTWSSRVLYFPNLFKVFNLRNTTYKNLSQFLNFIHKTIPHRNITMSENSQSLTYASKTRFVDSITLSSRMASEEKRILKTFFTQLQKYQCNQLILSLPHTTIYELAKYIVSSSSFCESTKDLSLLSPLRVDKSGDIDFLSHFNNLNNLELIFSGSLVPVTSSFNATSDIPLSVISKLRPGWSDNIRSLRIICDQEKVKSFPLLALLRFDSPFNWPSLKKLCVSGVTFEENTMNFSWLLKFSEIEELWLENNKNSNFSYFMSTMRDHYVFKNLKSLTFRENIINGRYDMDATNRTNAYGNNLKNLKSLDLMGTSISGIGLQRLASYFTTELLERLNIGNCPYIGFSRRNSLNDFENISTDEHFFENINNLKELYLHQLGSLNDDSIAALIQQIWSLKNLEKLDLSFNQSISGASIYELVLSIIRNNGKPITNLVLDGCSSISHVTINMMRDKKLVKRLDCIYEKEQWNQFGINSYKYRK